ncbi:MAG: DUF3352 domain-containing protein [Pseudanabaenaceae cyanobacterium bins.39]|nr:DUF3352 domain-containing protein [Pseudanabaenaceae cyanobacterium bins.39]
MTASKPNLLPIIGGAAVVVAGGVGAYLFTSKGSITPTASTAVGALSIVPQQSLMAMSISTDGEAIAKIEQFLTPETKKLYDQAVAEFRKGLSSGDVDYDKDIKPWIGKNVTIAFLPTGKSTSFAPRINNRYVPMNSNGEIPSVQLAQASEKPPSPATEPTAEAKPPNLIIVVDVSDKAGAEKFLTEKVKTKSGGKEKKSDYKGVTITQYGEGANASNSAMVGDYLVVAPSESGAQQAIDTFKGAASLASDTQATDLKMVNPVAQIYFPNFGDSIAQLAELGATPQTIPPQSLAELKKVKSMNMGIGIDDAGIRFKAAGKFDPAAIAALKNSPNKVISMIPSQAFSLITGSNIKTSWEQFVKSAENTPEIKEGIEQTRKELKSSPLALDLDKDIFGWMDGEFALASISAKPEGILAQTQGLAPLLMIQTTNRAAAESLLKKFDDFISKNGGQVSKKDVGGVSVTEWSAPGAPGALISHGWHQQDMMFITAAPVVPLFVPKPATAIDGEETFKSVVSTLPKDNVGYFYLDGDRTWKIVQSFIPPSELSNTPPEVKALIESVRGLAVTAAYPKDDTAEVEVLLALKKAAK